MMVLEDKKKKVRKVLKTNSSHMLVDIKTWYMKIIWLRVAIGIGWSQDME